MRLGKKTRLLAYTAVGVATFLVVFGFSSLNVGNEEFIFRMYPESDIAQNYAGWVAYKDEPWAFPLGRIQSFCWPDGSMTGFADSGPLVCVLLKLLAPILPATFQFIGWYTLLCYALQGLAAGLIVELYTQKLSLGLPAVALFTFSPIMMERAFRHYNLTAHFLILFAVYLYLAMRREGYRRLRWPFFLLSVAAMGTSPYFLPLVFAMLAVACFEYGRARRNVWKPLAFLAANAGAALLAGWALGSVGWVGGTTVRSGYGELGMNLNAPFNPQSLGDYRWSALISQQGQMPNQYDAFNYLGLGVLAFGLLVLGHWLSAMTHQPQPFGRAAAQNAGRFLRRHAPLLVVCLLLTLFAATNRLTWADRYAFTIPLPGFVTSLASIFRSSGRMFYLPYYLIYVFLVRYLALRFEGRVSCALLTVMVALQVGDMYAVIRQKHVGMTEPAPASVLNDPTLNAVAGGYDKLIFAEAKTNNPLLLFAAKHGLKSNNLRMASGAYPAAEALIDETYEKLLRGEYDSDTIYLVRNDEDHQRADALKAALASENVEFYSAYECLFIIPK